MGCGCSGNVKASLPVSARKYLCKLTGYEQDDLQNGILMLDMTKNEDQEVLKNLSDMKIPKFGAIKLKNVIKEDIKLINQVAVNSINSNLYIFSLRAVQSRVPLDSRPILKLASRVTQRFTLRNCKIEKDYIAKVIEACCQAEKVSFLNCVYTGESVFDIKTTLNFRISTLCFHNKEKKEKFQLDDIKKLAIKMQDTGLVESLQTFSVHDPNDKVKIRAILNDFGFGKVNIEEVSESE
ncbi:unnamed protein product [Moneuplotes crassus]|uniref:Uncharacterized protein n=1 Tax=Euplotes crassus TaxID=5936 RepID=A0AAD1XUL8_EUPCR|nr:unnamed protein product [Moneuplotes crassus]